MLRQYDYFRWLVLGSLLLLLLYLLAFRGIHSGGERLILSTYRLLDVTTAGVVGRVAGILQVQGTGQPSATVEFRVKDEPVTRATVEANGNWSLTQRIELSPGRYSVQSRMMGEHGGLLDEAEPFDVVMPDMATPKLALDTPQVADLSLGSGAGLVAGILDLQGTGHPGADVEIAYSKGLVAATKVDSNGHWGLYQQIELPPGRYDFHARMVDKNGSLWDETEPFELSFPEVEIAGLKLTAKRLEAPLPDNMDGSVERRLILSGRGHSGLVIRILRDGEAVGDTIVDADGNWNFKKSLAWKKQPYQLAAHMLAINGIMLDEAVTTLKFYTIGGSDVIPPIIDGGTEQSSGRVDTGRPVVELILDASGSMWAKIGENRRFEMARELLVNLISDVIPAGTPVALRAFGNIEGNYSCRNDLIVPLQPLERNKMRETINTIVPKDLAGSAIADSLSNVTEDLAEAKGSKLVLLITDGNESCGGDPVSAIETLVMQHDDLRVHVVGIAIEDNELKSEYERWAAVGRGRYFDVNNVQGFTESLARAVANP